MDEGIHYLFSNNVYYFLLQGLYDIHIQMQGVPIMAWDAPPLSNNIYASEVSFSSDVWDKHVKESAQIEG